MPSLTVLNPKEAKRFDLPPLFTTQERLVNFQLPPQLKRTVSHMKEGVSKVCFVLQYGYFKTNARFYSPAKFRKREIRYVCHLLGCETVDINDYNSTTNSRHRQRILNAKGWESFSESHRPLLSSYAEKQASNQLDSRKLFMALVDLCWEQQITVPGYETLATILTEAFNVSEKSVLGSLSSVLNDDYRSSLDGYALKERSYFATHDQPRPTQTHQHKGLTN